MSVAGITDGTGAVLGQASRDYSQINKLDFMTLLVAQIKNQDPTSPMDNAEFTGQLTQFSMLEQLEGMSQSLEDNLTIGTAINNTAMLSLVGRHVTVEGNETHLASGVASQNMIAAGGGGTATVTVKDAAGNVVRTYPVTVKTGLNDVTWDGKLADGTVAADGDYTISAVVKDSSGKDVSFKTLLTGLVEGLRYSDNQAVVTVNGEEFSVSEIYKVS